MSRILCYGARPDGHFNALHSSLTTQYDVDIVDDRLAVGDVVHGCTVVGGLDFKPVLDSKYTAFVVAIGDNLFRKHCFKLGNLNRLVAFSVIHSSAVISPSAIIGEGCYIALMLLLVHQ